MSGVPWYGITLLEGSIEADHTVKAEDKELGTNQSTDKNNLLSAGKKPKYGRDEL